jgi:hypothetical protein
MQVDASGACWLDADEHHLGLALRTGGAPNCSEWNDGRQALRLGHDASLEQAGAQHSLSPVMPGRRSGDCLIMRRQGPNGELIRRYVEGKVGTRPPVRARRFLNWPRGRPAPPGITWTKEGESWRPTPPQPGPCPALLAWDQGPATRDRHRAMSEKCQEQTKAALATLAVSRQRHAGVAIHRTMAPYTRSWTCSR